MKKILYFVVLAGLIIISCKSQKQSPPDLNAAKSNLEKAFNSYDSAFLSNNADATTRFYTDDILYCGTDPKEFWDKENLVKVAKESSAADTSNTKIIVTRRDIRVSKDGNSAIVIEQLENLPFSPIPVRIVYHAVKENNNWLIDFGSAAFIPNNEDVPKLNAALSTQETKK
jgi:ketosteroid isomerase-like protein